MWTLTLKYNTMSLKKKERKKYLSVNLALYPMMHKRY